MQTISRSFIVVMFLFLGSTAAIAEEKPANIQEPWMQSDIKEGAVSVTERMNRGYANSGTNMQAGADFVNLGSPGRQQLISVARDAAHDSMIFREKNLLKEPYKSSDVDKCAYRESRDGNVEVAYTRVEISRNTVIRILVNEPKQHPEHSLPGRGFMYIDGIESIDSAPKLYEVASKYLNLPPQSKGIVQNYLGEGEPLSEQLIRSNADILWGEELTYEEVRAQLAAYPETMEMLFKDAKISVRGGNIDVKEGENSITRKNAIILSYPCEI